MRPPISKYLVTSVFSQYNEKHGALRTPEERLPSGTPKEEFGRKIFQKKTSLGDCTTFRSTTSVGARGGAGTCDAPCILGRVLDSAFIQARVRLGCSDGLRYPWRYTFRAKPHLHEQLPRNFSTAPQGRFFLKIIRPNSSFGAPEGSLFSGVRNARPHYKKASNMSRILYLRINPRELLILSLG